MLLRCGFYVLLAFIVPLTLAAGPACVVLDSPDHHSGQALPEGFLLHARCGTVLIGTLPSDVAEAAGTCSPIIGLHDFSDIYQVDRRACRQHPDLLDRLTILFDNGDWVLFKSDGQELDVLSRAGIPFRAIPVDPIPVHGLDGCREGLDTIDPFVGVILDQIDDEFYEGYLQSLEDYITRNTYNEESVEAAQWIMQQFQSMGLTAWLDSFQINGYTRYNVIAEQTGSLHPDQMYYLTAHLDATAGLPIFSEDEAPGADDDGSGAAAVLESARVLSQFSFQNTIRYAVFSGNEQGLIGSEAYVAGLPSTGEVYLGVFDLDMIGWAGDDPWPPDLVIYSNDDPSSTLLADKVTESVSAFVGGMLEPVVDQDPTMVYADHAPFWDALIPAILLTEDEVWGSDLNPYYHSAEDLVEHLDIPYALQVLKTVLGAVADLSLPNGSTEPYLTTGAITIDDSQGNNNGRVEFGETISLTIPVINAGGADAFDVDVVLQDSDPYITFTDWSEFYGDILAQDTVEVVNAFSADVASNVEDQHLFEVTVLMSTTSSLWTSHVQIAAHAPGVVFDDITVDDNAGGNGNGRLEPGETAAFEITVINDGSYEAEDLQVTLSCNDPYIDIQTPTANYGTLQPYQEGTRNFTVACLAAAPPYFRTDFELSYLTTGGWTGNDVFSLEIGDLTHVPTGPDTYGYMAYDINDAPYAPVYNWVEIDPNEGGPGTELDFNDDDETLHLNLPFTFTYYGQSYTEISVCSNGWIACGNTTDTEYSNSTIPDENGPPSMMAPFWEDLSPQAQGTVSYYFDETNAVYIVEYNGVRDFFPQWDNMTFEVILFDPMVYQTATGDGEILFQYGELDNTSSCTVGIENESQDVGILYLYNTAYDEHASDIEDGMAILFTTGPLAPEISVALTYVSGSPVPGGGGNLVFDVFVENYGSVALDFDAWLDVTYEGGLPQTMVMRSFTNYQAGWAINRPSTWFPIPGSYAAGNYTMAGSVGEHPDLIWAESSFPFVKEGIQSGAEFVPFKPDIDFPDPFAPLAGDAGNNLALPQEFAVGQNYPNPFNPTTVIPLALPEKGQVKVELFNISGQQVAVITDGLRSAGQHDLRVDATGLPSGVYFYRVQVTGQESARKYHHIGKMLLVK